MSVGVSRLPPSLATGSAYGKGILIIHKVTGTEGILYLVPTVSLPVSHLTLLLTPYRLRAAGETIIVDVDPGATSGTNTEESISRR